MTDPLSGPEELAALAQTAGNGRRSSLVPFKVVGQLIAAVQDEQGRIVGEQVVGDIALYEPQFDDLRERVEQAWPQILAAQSGVRPSG